MPCVSTKNEQIPLVTPRYKEKLERNIDVCKSNQQNRSLIRHNKSIVMPEGLFPTRK